MLLRTFLVARIVELPKTTAQLYSFLNLPILRSLVNAASVENAASVTRVKEFDVRVSALGEEKRGYDTIADSAFVRSRKKRHYPLHQRTSFFFLPKPVMSPVSCFQHCIAIFVEGCKGMQTVFLIVTNIGTFFKARNKLSAQK